MARNNDDHLEFKSDRIFNPPLLGLYRGRTVKVQERGNTEGMSSTFWITDRGRSKIVSLDEVTLLDGNFIAPTVEQLSKILRDNIEKQDNE